MMLLQEISPQYERLVRFLQMIRLLWNLIFPSSKEQLIMPKGVKLLPVANFTLTFFNVCIFIVGNCW